MRFYSLPLACVCLEHCGADDVLATVARCGHPRSIVAIMNASPADVGIQTWACKTLMDLAFSGAHRVRIGQDGGVNAVVAAMLSFPTNEAVQEHGCGVLWLVAFHRTWVGLPQAWVWAGLLLFTPVLTVLMDGFLVCPSRSR